MQFEKLAFLLLALLIAAPAGALPRVPKGRCSLEGYLAKATNEENWYFILNLGTNAETRVQLAPRPEFSKLDPRGQFLRAKLSFATEARSYYIKGDFDSVEALMSPYEKPRTYSTDDLVDACSKKK